MELKPYPHQIELAEQAAPILLANKLVYMACEERTGKSIAGLLLAEQSPIAKRILIISTKKALDGWNETLAGCKPWLTKEYSVVNYHSAKKYPAHYDTIILDEAHSVISGFPKRGVIWKTIAKLTYASKQLIYMSATPYAQGIHALYNQFGLSLNSPWKQYKDGYKWYSTYALKEHGKNASLIWIPSKGGEVDAYNKADTAKAEADVRHLFIYKTRKEIGFEHEPSDVVHYVELDDVTRQAYNILMKKRVLTFTVQNVEYTLAADSTMKLRSALHMLEGGALKVDTDYLVLRTQEKINYIKKTWGDTDKIAIMYNYIAEGRKLRKEFKHAEILQGTSNAEGINLMHIDHLIIYSQNFSVAKHTQRRARQANIKRNSAINVHFLLTKKAISDQVYTAVVKKKTNFVDRLFEERMI